MLSVCVCVCIWNFFGSAHVISDMFFSLFHSFSSSTVCMTVYHFENFVRWIMWNHRNIVVFSLIHMYRTCSNILMQRVSEIYVVGLWKRIKINLAASSTKKNNNTIYRQQQWQWKFDCPKKELLFTCMHCSHLLSSNEQKNWTACAKYSWMESNSIGAWTMIAQVFSWCDSNENHIIVELSVQLIQCTICIHFTRIATATAFMRSTLSAGITVLLNTS